MSVLIGIWKPEYVMPLASPPSRLQQRRGVDRIEGCVSIEVRKSDGAAEEFAQAFEVEMLPHGRKEPVAPLTRLSSDADRLVRGGSNFKCADNCISDRQIRK